MSQQNSAADSAAELASILSKKLQKPKFPYPRNNTLRERLDSTSFPQTPSNLQDALSFFRVLFCKVSYVEESFRGEQHQISYQNIFFGMNNSDRIGFFRVFLRETCNEYFHFDLFDDLSEKINGIIPKKTCCLFNSICISQEKINGTFPEINCCVCIFHNVSTENGSQNW